MKTFWTPWRVEHVTGKTEKPEGCLFEPEGNAPASRRELLLYRDHHTLVLLNRFPYANGHLLVAPKQHVHCISELKEDELSALMGTIRAATVILRKHLMPHGFNIGCNIGSTAGAGIADHLHFHIVPAGTVTTASSRS